MNNHGNNKIEATIGKMGIIWDGFVVLNHNSTDLLLEQWGFSIVMVIQK